MKKICVRRSLGVVGLMVGLLLVSSASYASNCTSKNNEAGNLMIGAGVGCIASGVAAIGFQAAGMASNPFDNSTARVVPTERALRLGAVGLGSIVGGIMQKDTIFDKDKNTLSNLMIGVGLGLFTSGAAAIALQNQDNQSFYAQRGWFLNKTISQDGAISAMAAGIGCMVVGKRIRK